MKKRGGRTTEEQTGFGDNVLDVHGRFFRFSSDVAASGDDDEWIGFAVRILDVKPAKEDDCRRDHSLAEIQLLAELCDDCWGESRVFSTCQVRKSLTHRWRRTWKNM